MLHRFLESYQSDRIQAVKLRGVFLEPVFPQGSHIGLTMFLMLDDTLPRYAKVVNTLLYADDFKFFVIIKSDEDCLTLQRSIGSVNDRIRIFALEINVTKSVIMTQEAPEFPILVLFKRSGP